jgi:hypothetical protein
MFAHRTRNPGRARGDEALHPLAAIASGSRCGTRCSLSRSRNFCAITIGESVEAFQGKYF